MKDLCPHLFTLVLLNPQGEGSPIVKGSLIAEGDPWVYHY